MVLVISLSVVLTPFPFIFLTIRVYLHTARRHAHAFYGIRLVGVPAKSSFKYMQEIYRKTPMSKCDFKNV